MSLSIYVSVIYLFNCYFHTFEHNCSLFQDVNSDVMLLVSNTQKDINNLTAFQQSQGERMSSSLSTFDSRLSEMTNWTSIETEINVMKSALSVLKANQADIRGDINNIQTAINLTEKSLDKQIESVVKSVNEKIENMNEAVNAKLDNIKDYMSNLITDLVESKARQPQVVSLTSEHCLDRVCVIHV